MKGCRCFAVVASEPTGSASSARQAAESAAQYVELSAEYVDWLAARLKRRRLLSAAFVEPSAAWVELELGLRLGLGLA